MVLSPENNKTSDSIEQYPEKPATAGFSLVREAGRTILFIPVDKLFFKP
jgi:hypothetical protein